VAFSIPTLQAIIARLRADFRSEVGVDPQRRSIEYALLRALAGQSKGLYAYGAFSKDQGFPDRADSTHLYRWGAVWGLTQEAATPWEGTVTFTGVDTTIVPDGTELSRVGGQLYETDGAVTITSGEATATLVAKVGYEGSNANNDDDQPLSLSTPIVGVDSTATVASTTADGSDVETEADFLSRLLERIQNGDAARGGREGDYVAWAREVAGVTRAWEFPLLAGPNSVSIAFVRDNDVDIIPSGGERTAVEEYVQSQAPLTVEVEVITLVGVTVDLNFSALSPNTSDVGTAIAAAVTDFFNREAEPGATISLSRLNEAISSATGEISHALIDPSADIVLDVDEIAVLGTITRP
jgi:uncharacterized phage protein gp47/JayE